jgi:hypothetical protein
MSAPPLPHPPLPAELRRPLIEALAALLLADVKRHPAETTAERPGAARPEGAGQ